MKKPEPPLFTMFSNWQTLQETPTSGETRCLQTSLIFLIFPGCFPAGRFKMRDFPMKIPLGKHIPISLSALAVRHREVKRYKKRKITGRNSNRLLYSQLYILTPGDETGTPHSWVLFPSQTLTCCETLGKSLHCASVSSSVIRGGGHVPSSGKHSEIDGRQGLRLEPQSLTLPWCTAGSV